MIRLTGKTCTWLLPPPAPLPVSPFPRRGSAWTALAAGHVQSTSPKMGCIRGSTGVWEAIFFLLLQFLFNFYLKRKKSSFTKIWYPNWHWHSPSIMSPGLSMLPEGPKRQVRVPRCTGRMVPHICLPPSDWELIVPKWNYRLYYPVSCTPKSPQSRAQMVLETSFTKSSTNI